MNTDYSIQGIVIRLYNFFVFGEITMISPTQIPNNGCGIFDGYFTYIFVYCWFMSINNVTPTTVAYHTIYYHAAVMIHSNDLVITYLRTYTVV